MDTTVTDGMTAVLRCEVSGAPKPAITWRRGRSPVQPGPHGDEPIGPSHVCFCPALLRSFSEDWQPPVGHPPGVRGPGHPRELDRQGPRERHGAYLHERKQPCFKTWEYPCFLPQPFIELLRLMKGFPQNTREWIQRRAARTQCPYLKNEGSVKN